MKLICNISNTQYQLIDTFKTFSSITAQAKHPIFSLELSQLEKIYNHGFLFGKLSQNEIRLLSLALAHNTQLITWNIPAKKDFSLKIALESLAPLLMLNHSIADSLRKESLLARLPKLIINEENKNHSMFGLIDFISECNDIISKSEYYISQQQFKQERKELLQLTMKRIKAKQSSKPSRFISRLSSYCINLLDECEDYKPARKIIFKNGKQCLVKDYYIYLIDFAGNSEAVLKEKKSKYPIQKDNLIKLIDLLTSQLNASDIFIFEAIELLNTCLKSGIYNKYGISNIDMSLLAEKDIKSLELEFSSIAGNEEPLRTEFHDYNSYYIARSKWLIRKNDFINGNGNNI
jgi:hypothetical protein